MSPQKTASSQKKPLPMTTSQAINSYKEHLPKASAAATRTILKSTSSNGAKPVAASGAREKSAATMLHDDEEPQPHVEPDHEPEPQSRSRTASSSTLLARSQPQSQQSQQSQQIQPQPQPQLSQNLMQGGSRKASQKSEEIAFAELLVLTRRYYLAFLSNTRVDEPVKAVFPNMKMSHSQYKKAATKVRQNYKNWKTAMLEAAVDFITRWLDTVKANETIRLSALHTHKELRKELLTGFRFD